jgi:predicted nucleic acid-binding protein
MEKTVIVDSGVIVAALLQRDLHHAWAKTHLERMTGCCLTCEAVLSECFYLLDHDFEVYRRNGRQRIPLLAPWW